MSNCRVSPDYLAIQVRCDESNKTRWANYLDKHYLNSDDPKLAQVNIALNIDAEILSDIALTLNSEHNDLLLLLSRVVPDFRHIQ